MDDKVQSQEITHIESIINKKCEKCDTLKVP